MNNFELTLHCTWCEPKGLCGSCSDSHWLSFPRHWGRGVVECDSHWSLHPPPPPARLDNICFSTKHFKDFSDETLKIIQLTIFFLIQVSLYYRPVFCNLVANKFSFLKLIKKPENQTSGFGAQRYHRPAIRR